MFNKLANQWFNQLRMLSLREQAAIVVLGFVLIYFFWNLILMHPLLIQQQQLKEKINAIRDNLNLTENELIKAKTGKKISENDSREMRQNFAKMIASSQNPSLPRELINQIVTYRSDAVEFISLKSDAPVPWEISDVFPGTSVLQNMTKYSHQINVNGNYFGVIRYLQFMEGLPAYLYWDSLNYTVLNYPNSNMTMKFYTIGK